MKLPGVKCVVTVSAVFFLMSALYCSAIAGTNVALGQTAWANSTYATSYASQAVDGDVHTGWTAQAWGTAANPYWLEVDLGKIYQLEKVVLTGGTSSDPTYIGYSHVFNLYLSANNVDWSLIGHGELLDTIDPVETLVFTPVDTRYIKYEVVGGTHWAGLCELEAYAASAVPEPSSVMVLLSGFAGIPLVGRFRKGKSA